MYAYRPQGERRDLGSTRYFSAFDRVMVLIGLAAVLAIVISGFVTHGSSILTALNAAFGR